MLGWLACGGTINPSMISIVCVSFDASKANCGGGLADVLKIDAGCFRCEIGSHGAWVRVKPFLHVDLELVLGMLVLEDVGHLSCAPMVRSGGPGGLLGRASWDTERDPDK